MKNKKILQYLSTYLLLILAFVMFLISKFSYKEAECLTGAIVCLVLFCITNRITDKKIQCKDGYNLFQAFSFYKKCYKRGVTAKAVKLKKKDMQIIVEVAKNYDYCKNFTDEQLIELYRSGENI